MFEKRTFSSYGNSPLITNEAHMSRPYLDNALKNFAHTYISLHIPRHPDKNFQDFNRFDLKHIII